MNPSCIPPLTLSARLASTLICLCVFMAVAQGQSAVRTQTYYLSGTGKDDQVEWDFFCSEGRKSQEWTTIGVPSCWEQEGFGAYNYGHDPMDQRALEYGLYKHSFFVPKDWKGREVSLVFEGVMTDATVSINGKSAGEVHQGAFYEFKYSITDLLTYGKANLLEVKVQKVSTNESINYAERKADFWVFGGIYRPVYLQVLPKEHIERIAIDAKANGDIKADLFINAPHASTAQLKLWDMQGNLVQPLTCELTNHSDNRFRVTTKALDIQRWNPERPYLYQLGIDLIDADGNTLHHLKQRIGFRTVEVRAADGIYVNGQRIKFKGVNRHSFYPQSGRTTSKALSIEHVTMMKDMNMNAVRMSHYPPDVHFLDVCDSLGLFVIDEVCTWHSPSLDTEIGRKIVKETVVRDVNHPSILLWANGNETGWNTELDDDYAIWDIQQREVIHPWNIFRKTNTLHYMYYHGLARDVQPDKIFFPTEFLHGLYDGGHGAGLADYWQLMWHMPMCAGGFLWDFADEGLVRTDKENIIDTDGNHAADGIVGPYGEKEASYFTIKEIWSPIYIEDRYIRADFNGLFRIENRYHFTRLRDCSMKARWVQFTQPGQAIPTTELAQYDVQLPSLAPGEQGTFSVPKPPSWQTADALYLTATDPTGHHIWTWTYPVKLPKVLNEALLDYTPKGTLSSTIVDNSIYITTEKIEFEFSKKTGRLISVKKEGQVIPLSNGPILLGQNDQIDTVMIQPMEHKIELIAVFKKAKHRQEWVTHKKRSADLIKWTVNANGLLDLAVEMKYQKKVRDLKGISFSFPETEVAGMNWLGDGPYRVWRNRRKGTQFQVHTNTYNNTVTGESGYLYPEFKGYYSNLYWVKVRGKQENGFTVYCHSQHTYLRMLTPTPPTGDPKGRVTPDFPEGDISFLKNIPAIGTKFQEPDLMGPHAHSENFFGNYDEPLRILLTFEF